MSPRFATLRESHWTGRQLSREEKLSDIMITCEVQYFYDEIAWQNVVGEHSQIALVEDLLCGGRGQYPLVVIRMD
jgi:hypothetical protein